MRFIRSGGDRGASVETLRGKHGANFEGTAIIRRPGGSGTACFCLFGNTDDKKEKFLLIKGPFCFVFKNETSSSPLYAISLVHLITNQNGTTVQLETQLGDVDFEITFPDAEMAQNFCTKLKEQAQSGEAAEIKKVKRNIFIYCCKNDENF